MPISKAIEVVATVGSPNSLNIRSAVSRMRSRVRRGGLAGMAGPAFRRACFCRPLKPRERRGERLRAWPGAARGTIQQRRRRIEGLEVKLDAMALEDRRKLARAPPKLRERAAIGVLREAPAVGVAEDVGEEHDRIVL